MVVKKTGNKYDLNPVITYIISDDGRDQIYKAVNHSRENKCSHWFHRVTLNTQYVIVGES